MTLNEIKKSAPSGATHFYLQSYKPIYYMQSGQQNFVYDGGIWRVVNTDLTEMTKL